MRIPVPPDIRPHSAQIAPQRVTRRNLDGWALAALDGRHDYRTPYAALCAVASHATARGWDSNSLWNRCEGLARAQCERDRRPAHDRRVSRIIGNAWTFAAKRPGDPFTLARALDAARARAAAQTWNGRAGTGQMLTLGAVLDAAKAQRTLAPSLAVRSLSIATGLGKSTVHRALTALAAQGWLRQVSKATGDRASTYRILRTEALSSTGTDTAPSGTQGLTPYGTEGLSHLVPPHELAALDAFAPKALGRTAARVLASLDALSALTPSQVAAATGLSVPTVRRALCTLEAVGVVARTRSGRGFAWTRRLDVLEAERDRIAHDYGTAGAAQRREATYSAQRERWSTYVRQKAEALDRARSIYRPAHTFARVAA